MSLFEAHKEKENDIRVLERKILLGKFDPKTRQKMLSSLPDDTEQGLYVNIDELNASDNPVHVPRGLPKYDTQAPKNIEDIEFDLEDTSRKYEQ